MAHTYINLLTHALFSTRDRKPCLDAELKPELFSYMGAPRNLFAILTIPSSQPNTGKLACPQFKEEIMEKAKSSRRAASLATAQKNDQAEVLLQAALHKQLVDGDLEGAIQQYKNIMTNFSSDRAATAKALVEMGECYEKLAKTKRAKLMSACCETMRTRTKRRLKRGLGSPC